MKPRSHSLQSFVDAARKAFDQAALDSNGRRVATRVFQKLQTVAPQSSTPGVRVPACSHLLNASSVETHDSSLRVLLDCFGEIEPGLRWKQRTSLGQVSDSANPFGNAMILGPGGLEEREDVWVGVSLLAPNVRYPDHHHPPEEVYLVMSDGDFRQAEAAWFSPGVGGSFYNPPGIQHAMRSTAVPLLAFWLLPVN